jgi:O-antigen/teichoic acid export membrane protein
MTLALLPLLGLAMGIAAFCGANHSANPIGMIPLALAAIAGMLLWQMQETVRRGLMAELRFAACIPGDALSYLGQAALLGLMAWSGRLTLPWAFIIIGATSAMAVVIQGVQIGLVRITIREVVSIARDFWKLGSWTLLANLAMFITTVGYSWTLKIFHGLDVTAALAALVITLKPVNPMLMGVGNLLVPAVARVARHEGPRATIRAVWRYALLGGVVVFSYYGLLFAFPTLALRIVFGPNSPYLGEATLLRFYLINMSIMYVEMVLLSWLYGLGESRANFVTQSFQAAVALLVSLPLTAIYGIPGLIAGGFIGTTLCVVAQLMMLRKALNLQVADLSPHVISFDESRLVPD